LGNQTGGASAPTIVRNKDMIVNDGGMNSGVLPVMFEILVFYKENSFW
jgi:hypothetical protein